MGRGSLSTVLMCTGTLYSYRNYSCCDIFYDTNELHNDHMPDKPVINRNTSNKQFGLLNIINNININLQNQGQMFCPTQLITWVWRYPLVIFYIYPSLSPRTRDPEGRKLDCFLE